MMKNDRDETFLQTHGNWAAAIRQAWILTVISIVIGAGSWLVRPDRLPLMADPEIYALDLPAPLISLQQARELYEQGNHFFIDTRRGEIQESETIPGAFVIREASFADDLNAVMDFIYPEDNLILFGESSPMPVTSVAVRFLDRGYRHVKIMQGGLEAWLQDGGPIGDGESDDE
jgi:rhodanese-related sulfurtransferase